MKLLKNIRGFFKQSNESLIDNLRKKGALVGDNTVFFSPDTINIDIGKAFLLRIGNYCKITSGVTILAHDYSRSVTRLFFGENVGGSAPVTIGDNCFLGMNSIILMGTKIGNNCIVGAGSVVKGNFPNNVIIAGNPAKIIYTLDEFYEKRKSRCLDEALMCVKQIYDNTGKLPTISQMGDGFAWIYLPRNLETIAQFPNFFCLSADDPDDLKDKFLNSKPMFDNYNTFLEYAIKKLNLNISI